MLESWKKILICHLICNFKTNLTYFENITFRMQPKRSFNLYLLSSKWICSLREWVKIQYLWWMLNNICCVPHEKSTFILFNFYEHKFWRWQKKTKFTANTALKQPANVVPSPSVLNTFHSFVCWYNSFLYVKYLELLYLRGVFPI